LRTSVSQPRRGDGMQLRCSRSCYSTTKSTTTLRTFHPITRSYTFYTRLPRQRHLTGPLAYRLPTPFACGLLCFFDLNRVIPLLRDDHPCAFIAPFAVRVGHRLWLMRDYSPRERPVWPEQGVLLVFIFSLRRTLQLSVLLPSLCGVERIAIAN
jgi:hypothetical protein